MISHLLAHHWSVESHATIIVIRYWVAHLYYISANSFFYNLITCIDFLVLHQPISQSLCLLNTYPFDKNKKKFAWPLSLTRLHRYHVVQLPPSSRYSQSCDSQKMAFLQSNATVPHTVDAIFLFIAVLLLALLFIVLSVTIYYSLKSFKKQTNFIPTLQLPTSTFLLSCWETSQKLRKMLWTTSPKS